MFQILKTVLQPSPHCTQFNKKKKAGVLVSKTTCDFLSRGDAAAAVHLQRSVNKDREIRFPGYCNTLPGHKKSNFHELK